MKKYLYKSDYALLWAWYLNFRGGEVETGESAEQAATRELREETGLVDLVVIGCHTLVNDFGSNIHYVILHAQSDAEPVAVDQRRQQIFHWLKPTDIPRQDFFKADLEFMEAYLTCGYPKQN